MTIQTEQKTPDVPQVQRLHRVVDVPVVTRQRQVSLHSRDDRGSSEADISPSGAAD